MNKLFHNKKLLILGGNPETGELVKTANQLGITTLVVDPNPDSPAKKFAHKSYDVDGMDIDGIVKIANIEQVDGVLVGVADILVPSYAEVCQILNFPCYASKATIEAFSSKDRFISICREHDIKTPKNFNIKDVKKNSSEFPLIVKPVDNGGGVGMIICHDYPSLLNGIEYSLSHSNSKNYIIEKYLECNDLQVYYTIINGEIFLSATNDRILTKSTGKVPVCLGSEYPSSFTKIFLKKENEKFKKLFQKIPIINGIISIQLLFDGIDFYAYDPGFRLQGEGQHIHLNAIQKYDHRKMLVQFALTGCMFEGDFSKINDPFFSGKHSLTLWILLNSGKISRVDGLQEIRSNPNVFDIMLRFQVGDLVTQEMVGTERQVFARIYVVGDSRLEIKKVSKFIHEHLEIYDQHGDSMIVDRFYPE